MDVQRLAALSAQRSLATVTGAVFGPTVSTQVVAVGLLELFQSY